MTKYFYEGQLIRTSKTRSNYKYALVRKTAEGFKTYKCSSKYEECVKEFNYMTKGDKLAKQDGITLHEAWIKYNLYSSQCRWKEEDLLIVELEVRA